MSQETTRWEQRKGEVSLENDKKVDAETARELCEANMDSEWCYSVREERVKGQAWECGRTARQLLTGTGCSQRGRV